VLATSDENQLKITSRETQVKVDGPGGRRSKEDENYWLEGED